jgi:hypothetical protein
LSDRDGAGGCGRCQASVKSDAGGDESPAGVGGSLRFDADGETGAPSLLAPSTGVAAADGLPLGLAPQESDGV